MAGMLIAVIGAHTGNQHLGLCLKRDIARNTDPQPPDISVMITSPIFQR